jgi:hypothetical protein
MSRSRASIPSQFVPHRIEMIESPAWRALSLSGRRVVDRIEIELGHHGGNDNGRLPVTFDQFEEFGVSHKCVAPAIREAVALGFITVTQRGRPSRSDLGRHPNCFQLNFMPVRRGVRWRDPTDEWKQIQTLEEALQIAREAREAKDTVAVTKAKAKVKKTEAKSKFEPPQKSFAGGEKFLVTGGESHPVSPRCPGGESPPTATGGESPPTSISRGSKAA